MSLTKIVKTAMVNNDINTMKELAEKAGITYFKVSGFISGDENIKLVDLKSMLDALDLKVKFISKGEE